MGRTITNTAILVAVTLSLAAAPSSSSAAQQQVASAACHASGPLVQLPGLVEASGLAVSRRVPGRLWAHNDSGQPVLFALDARGAVTGQIRVTGAKVEDWEAIAVGPCPSGSCVYIGDIGDNDAERRRVTIYRLTEPEAASGTVAVADVFHATYPDGAHDAEALLVAADGRVHIITKGDTGPIGIYRFPSQLQSGATARLERVGAPVPMPERSLRVTDAAVSPDGQWVVVRTEPSLTFYRASDLLGGQWRAATRVDLAPLKEPQGEGVAVGGDNTVYVAGEGGGKGRPGTFARFSCTPKV